LPSHADEVETKRRRKRERDRDGINISLAKLLRMIRNRKAETSSFNPKR
jgi:hypothetical protein